MSDREKVINDLQMQIEELEERLAIVLEGQQEPCELKATNNGGVRMKEIQLPVTELLAGLAEECCELAQAALKLRRFYDQTNPTPIDEVKATEDFYEELADVSLYLDQIHFPLSYVVEIKKAKLNRWKERLGKEVDE